MKWLPLWFIDKILIFLAWLILGNVEKYGLKRPKIGPLQLKNVAGKTPVLDIGALSKIRSGKIKVVPGIKKFLSSQVELLDREVLNIYSIVLATGYRSNVPSWLKVRHRAFDVFLLLSQMLFSFIILCSSLCLILVEIVILWSACEFSFALVL